ncbi:MAG: Rrf2 family transcriptional regulator [Clostridia bacterium]
MHMTLEANYAVKIVELLSFNQEKIDAKTIARESQVPERFALKILRKLVSDKIVLSFKGSKGGYLLNGKPSEINLRMVIESVEGPFRISRCQQNEYTCSNPDCRLHTIYNDISLLVRERLESYTFADVCGKKCGDKNEKV